jgi:hypothetical protein
MPAAWHVVIDSAKAVQSWPSPPSVTKQVCPIYPEGMLSPFPYVDKNEMTTTGYSLLVLFMWKWPGIILSIERARTINSGTRRTVNRKVIILHDPSSVLAPVYHIQAAGRLAWGNCVRGTRYGAHQKTEPGSSIREVHVDQG